MILPATTRRVVQSTRQAQNDRIRMQTEQRLRELAGFPDRIDERLVKLDREWDVERLLQTNAASLALGGLGLSVLVDRRFVALPAVVLGFLLQHALWGWCPPVEVIRRLGVRTAREIEVERHALKVLRGDYLQPLPQGREDRVRHALEAARR